MASEESRTDLETSRDLAAEITELSEFEQAQAVKISAGMKLLALPDSNTMKALARTAWEECWVDSPAKKLLWEARADGVVGNYMPEIASAYVFTGDIAEAQAVIDGMSDSKLPKIEALLRFGSLKKDGKTYIDTEYLQHARTLAANLPDQPQMARAYGRIAFYSREPADFKIWQDLAAVSSRNLRKCIGELLVVAGQGYLPALDQCKKMLITNYPMPSDNFSSYQGSDEMTTEKQSYDELVARVGVIERHIQQAAIPIIPVDHERTSGSDYRKKFDELLESHGVLLKLRQGVRLRRPLSPLEQDVLRIWKPLAKNTILKTEDDLWEYARTRIEFYKYQLTRSDWLPFTQIRSLADQVSLSKLVHVPQREVPISHQINALGALARLETRPEYVEELRKQGIPWLHDPYTKAERKDIAEQYRREEVELAEETAIKLREIDQPLVFRALYYSISGASKADIYL